MAELVRLVLGLSPDRLAPDPACRQRLDPVLNPGRLAPDHHLDQLHSADHLHLGRLDPLRRVRRKTEPQHGVTWRQPS